MWTGPPLLAVSAFKGTTAGSAAGPAVAIRVGLAVAALAFALALGPEARDFGRAIGPAPYVLLTYVSSAFEGTRAPARFGGIMLLFLAVVASGVLAMLFRDSRRPVRLAGVAIAGAALAACAMELPLPPLPKGQQLVTLAHCAIAPIAGSPTGSRRGHSGAAGLAARRKGGLPAARVALAALHARLQAAPASARQRQRPHRAVSLAAFSDHRTVE